MAVYIHIEKTLICTMSEKLKIYFAGSGKIAVPVLEALINAPEIEVVGVGTQPDRPVGRKKILTPTPVGAAAAPPPF